MGKLSFEAVAVVRGQPREREGIVEVDGNRIRFSAPKSSGGKGVGASPESLLASAVGSCYALALHSHLQGLKLPLTEVEVRVEGIVAGDAKSSRFTQIAVHPTIRGADPGKEALYRDAAAQAREQCFVGRTIAAAGVEYVLGKVRVSI